MQQPHHLTVEEIAAVYALRSLTPAQCSLAYAFLAEMSRANPQPAEIPATGNVVPLRR
jgi:hypothetical protein